MRARNTATGERIALTAAQVHPSRGSRKGANLFWAQLDGSRTPLAVRTTSFPLGSQTRSAGLRPDPAKLSNAPSRCLKWTF